MTASVSTLPIWKKDSTPAEWLQEVAALALEHPERFGRIVVIYEERAKDNTAMHIREQSYKCENNVDILGLLDWAKFELFEWMKGRRS